MVHPRAPQPLKSAPAAKRPAPKRAYSLCNLGRYGDQPQEVSSSIVALAISNGSANNSTFSQCRVFSMAALVVAGGEMAD